MIENLREVIGVAMLSLVPILGLAAFLAVRRKASIQAGQLGAAPQPPLESASIRTFDRLFYVATTFSDKPLERLWAYGLGSRGYASLKIHKDGVSILRQGEKAFFLPREGLAVSTSRATIDRGTESNGLIQLHWQLGEEHLTTLIRAQSTKLHAEIIATIREMANAGAK